jgi:hypothetical protein
MQSRSMRTSHELEKDPKLKSDCQRYRLSCKRAALVNSATHRCSMGLTQATMHVSHKMDPQTVCHARTLQSDCSSTSEYDVQNMMCTVNVSVMEGRRQCIPMLWDWLPGSEIAFIVQALGCEYRHAGSCLQGVCGRARILFDQSQYAAAFNLSRRTRSTQLTWMMNPTLCCINSIGDFQREHQQGGPGPTIGTTHKVGNVMRLHSVRSLET